MYLCVSVGMHYIHIHIHIIHIYIVTFTRTKNLPIIIIVSIDLIVQSASYIHCIYVIIAVITINSPDNKRNSILLKVILDHFV